MERNAYYYKAFNGVRAVRNWVIPYLYSRIHNGRLRPLVGYLVTDWKCNVKCHYCFQYKNNMDGMTRDTAFSSIDWLKSVGCGVVGITGGEPLVRKDLVLDIIRYARGKGLFVDLATNGFFMDEELIDEIGAAGVASINLAVDCIKSRKGMPKALLSIEPQFRYMVKQQKKYNYILFLNINICSTNIKDVKLLTEIANQNRIGVDYHLNEIPQKMINTDHYENMENDLWINPNHHEEVDDLADWLIEKHKSGWAIVNPVKYFKDIKLRIRGDIPRWDCRAGHNGVLIKPDGSLVPCYNLMNYDHDWGRIWEPMFEIEGLQKVKDECVPKCTSIVFHSIGSYYQTKNLPKWVMRHTRMG